MSTPQKPQTPAPVPVTKTTTTPTTTTATPAPVVPKPVVQVPKKQYNQKWLYASPFVLGGMASCCATSTIQPLDMVKVRLQLVGELGSKVVTKNPFTMAKNIFQKEGVLAFYKGLSAALVRQLTYGTARLGLFRTISDNLKEPGKSITPGKSALAGLSAGALAAVIGTPADVVLVRMQSDFTLPVAQRRNYKNIFDALVRMVKEEGAVSLWKGVLPTVARAMALNIGMLTTYDLGKEQLKNRTALRGGLLNFSASMISGFFAAAFSLPFDFLKTRVQKQKAGPDGKLPYKGMVDCAIKVLKTEGPLAYYKGFGTFYIRVAPHAMITLNVLELLTKKARAMNLQP
eukprot:TRINITY_DN5309_c0_g1_i1.p1 TRINITY_DN5309_c0_g1~~TRINITY_DN5309_c0_g1_i1.p1  ORF type:complete len:344 (-),score=93.70 TRINITY_DN5309_c0_g1_i1:291-1322(-)